MAAAALPPLEGHEGGGAAAPEEPRPAVAGAAAAEAPASPAVEHSPPRPGSARTPGCRPAEARAWPPAESAADGSEEPAEDIPAVQVCVRMRPLLGWERQEGHQCSAVTLKEGKRGGVTVKPREGNEESGRLRSFRFDAVAGPDCSQEDAWAMARVEGMVDKVVAGFHATVFAYGQTGSGKTHTMEGFTYSHHNGASAPSAAAGRPKVRLKATPPEQLGFVPRAASLLFERVEALQAKARAEGRGSTESLSVKVSFLQIYNEHAYDLLNPVHTVAQIESGSRAEEHAGLRIRWDAVKRQFFAENLFEYECQTAEELLDHYGTGLQHKQVASTGMNVASSRSHTVLVVKLVRRRGLKLDEGQDDVEAPATPVKEVVSKLALVDLAGSERASASNSAAGGDRNAKRFHEAVNVNQSLFVLRKVITALSKRPEGGGAGLHIPYRESKLTSLLQHSIGGNGFLLMVACLSPSDRHYEENLSTLSYASQAACIKNAPTVNVDPKDRLIQQLEAKLAAAHDYILRHLGLTELPQSLLDAGGGPGDAALKRSRVRRSARSVDKREKRGADEQVASRTAPPGFGLPASARGAPGGSAARGASCNPQPPPAAPAEQPAPPRRARERPPPRQPSEGDELFAMADAMMARSFYGAASSGPHRQGDGAPLGGGDGAPPGGFAASGDSAGARPSQAWSSRASAGAGRHNRLAAPALGGSGGLPPVCGGGGSSGSRAQAAAAPSGAAPPGDPAPRGGQPRGLQRSPPQASPPGGGGKAAPTAESRLTGRSASADAAGATGAAEPCPSRDSTPAAAHTPAAGAEAEAEGAAAAQSGLWDAVEELKRDRAELRSQLRAAERRASELQEELQRARGAAAAPPGGQAAEAPRPPTPRRRPASGTPPGDSPRGAGGRGGARPAAAEAPGAAEARAVAEAALAAASVEREALAAERAAMEAERDALRSEREALTRRGAEAAEAAAACQAQAARERDELRGERDSLKERLDVFYRALGEEQEAEMEEAATSAKQVEATRMGEKVERLHSQLVLECVQLRSEAASLKKKKWVLRAVLAKGGERESEAIGVEIEQLRQEKRAAPQPLAVVLPRGGEGAPADRGSTP